MNLEDLEALEKKRKKQECLQEEIMRINAETMQAKERRLEEERQADMRDMEYLKNKMERASEFEAEQKRLKKEKELEIARLRARQEKAKDYKAEQDELRARRNQEFKDRDWRSKQKELAVKKAQEEEMLMAARTEQVRCKEHFLSIEAGREKAEFERVLSAQLQAIVKLKEEEEKRRQKSSRHAEAIRTQVKEQELSAVAKRLSEKYCSDVERKARACAL
ncbi:Cilia- and flagella-associated protein 45 [Dissostichus eleginoides]|uniref:Cilia- and flagella-associated protein 45 n=1 Tax=Dissostichus eleginoides TaxID=100907 RepID=A0AAD9FBW0_DISEL|nr:Cilia- and flagella-associated protein 45 [Dissostichus eleginoides]